MTESVKVERRQCARCLRNVPTNSDGYLLKHYTDKTRTERCHNRDKFVEPNDTGVVTLKPWLVTPVVHIYPGNDMIEHRLGQECACQPTAETKDESIIVRHKALDGRKDPT